LACGNERAWKLDVRAGKILAVGVATPTMKDADQIDDRVAPLEQGRKRAWRVDIGLNHLDSGQRHDSAGTGKPTRGHTHAQAPRDALRDQGPANEASTAQD
jgi:hypothetical protein